MDLIIASLATWRLTLLLVSESGPYDILERFRVMIGVRYNEFGERYGKNVLAEALLCFRCTSVWVAAAVVLLMPGSRSVIEVVLRILATSALAILLNELVIENGEG